MILSDIAIKNRTTVGVLIVLIAAVGVGRECSAIRSAASDSSAGYQR